MVTAFDDALVMVIRRRLAHRLLPLAFYVAAGCVAWFFVNHAHHGQRGLETKQALKREHFKLQIDFDALKRERALWERNVALLKSDAVDRDMLDERARHLLNRVHRDDVVIILPTR